MKNSLQIIPSACKEQITGITGKQISNRRYGLTGQLRISIFIMLSLLLSGLTANAQQPINGPAAVCVGSTITLSETTTGGVWSSSNTTIATVNASGVVYGVSAGIDIISYTVPSVGTVTAIITVNASPNAGTISGFNAICIGNTIPFTTNGVTGGVWGTKWGFVSVDANGNVTGQYKGMDTVKYTVTNGTCSSYAAANISVVGILDNIYTYAGNGNATYTGNNVPAFQATVSGPRDLYVDTLTASVYFCDQNNQIVRKISSSGIITTVAGNGTNATRTYSLTNGMAATAAALSVPNGVFSDKNGNVFISNSNSANICKVNASGILTVIAGQVKKAAGATADGGPATAANIGIVYGIVEDPSGAILFVDQTNNAIRKISKSDGTGILTTVVGSSGVSAASYTGDGGPGTAATLNNPVGITMDNSGNLYISDGGNNVIRKLSPSGIITTFAGSRSGTAGYSGDGGPATAALLNTPARFAYDGSNNLYVSDQGNNVIRQINLINNTITTVAGIGGAGGYNNDDIPATTAQLNVPAGIAADHFGNFFISDAVNNRVRFVNSTGSTIVVISGPSEVCAGTPITLTARSSVTGSISYQWTKNGVVVSTGNTVLTNSNPVNGDVYQCVGHVIPVCGSPFNVMSNTITLIVDQPATSISGVNGNVCIGSTTQLSDVAAGGVWTTSNTLIATINAAGILTGVAAGSSTVTYAVTNTCSSSTVTLGVNVSPTFTITSSAGNGGSISPSGVTTVCAGNNQAYIITPNSGYTISSVLVDGVSQGAITSYTFSNISANHTITATFAINTTYTIIASAGANGSISPSGTTTANYGDNDTYTITAATGYYISNVLVDGVSVGAVSSYTFSSIAANHTIAATFAINTYTIVASAGANGSISNPGTITANYGDNDTYTITPATGYSVNNVLVDGVSVGAVGSYTFSSIAANHTIAATFVINTYTIVASAGANGSISNPGTITANYGDNDTYTITPATGYSVSNVLVDGVSVGAVSSYTFSSIAANHTIAATFAINTYTIAASAGANGSISNPGTITANYGDNDTYTITPATGYSVSNVLVDGVSVGAVSSYTFSSINANHTITATFAINTYTIVATAGSNGSISPSGTTTANYGDNDTYTITPATGYSVSNVLVDGVSVGSVSSYTFSSIAANHTIAATFAINTYTIAASAGANGSISNPGTITANYGDNDTYTITPATGYSVSNVLVDGVSVGAVGSYTFSSIAANHTITAAFAINTYTIVATAGSNGSISPSGTTTANYGDNDTYTITPATGYSVSNVLVDGVSVGAVSSYTFSSIAANHTIAATFAINTYTIVASAGTNGSISNPGTITANYGDNDTYTITPATGYYISNVLVDGVSVGAVSSYTFSSIAANHTIAATFAINTYTIVASAGTNGSISNPGTITANYGDNDTYTITPATGYYISNVLVDGVSVGAVSSYTFSSIAANHTIAATFAINTYTIVASAGANGSISNPGTTTANYGDNDTYTITPATGYSVSNVLVDGVSVGAVGSYTFNSISANHTISVTFAINTYTIVASAGANGSISPSGTSTANYGDNDTYTMTAATGFHVGKVLVDGVNVGAVSTYTFSLIAANHTISVSFEVNHDTITATAGLNGSISPAGSTSVINGSNQTYTITPATGYSVSSVLVDGVSVGAVTSYTFSSVSANHTISVTFAINTYTIVATTGANGSISPVGTTTVNYGSNQTYTITPATGYSVSSVLVDGVSVGAVTSYTFSSVTANHTISVTFAINTYTIVATTGANGSISPVGTTTVNYGSNQTYTITPATGYSVSSVLVDGVSVGAVTSYTFSSVTANHTISVTFAINTYTIVATTGANGSISPAGTTTVNYGGNQVYTMTPATGYRIDHVLVDGVNVGDVTSYTFSSVSANHTISVAFAVQTYTITASTGANGSISPSGTTTVNSGSNQVYTITPATGYSISSVLVDGVSVGAVGSYTFSSVSANHTIGVTFAISTYNIVASAGSNGSISPSGTTTVNYNGNQVYTITPATGYSVSSVLVDGVSVGAVSSYTFSAVTANHTISVTFAINTYTIVATTGANGSISPAGTTTVNYGGNQVYTMTPATGYRIDHVLVDGVNVGDVTSYTFSSVSANHTISVAFAVQTYTITASTGANGSISPSGTTTVNSGSNQVYTITPATGYSISNVLVDGVSAGAVGSYTFSSVSANHTISVTFAINTYTIAATTGANGSISPSGTTTVNYGGNQVYTITPATGYSVSNVLVDGVSIGAVTSYTFSAVSASHTISVTFVAKTYTITASAGANGNISPLGATTVNNGGSQAYTITPATGYSVSSVLVDGVSVGAISSYTFSSVSANHTISVTFAINTYNIVASAGANGSISPLGTATVSYGGSQVYTITPATGYSVSSVLVDGSSVGTVATYTFSSVTANHTISVTFIANASPLSCTTGPALGFSVFLENNGTFSGSETDGPVAMGGDLTIAGSYNVATNNAGTYTVGDATIGLLVGGKVNYSAGSSFQVNQNTYVKIGDSTGSHVWYTDNNGAYSPIRITPTTNYNSSPDIALSVSSNNTSALGAGGVSATHNPVFQSGLINFTSAFSQMSANATCMSENTDNSNLTNPNGNTIAHSGFASGTQAKITLNPGMNVLNLTGADLNNLGILTFNNTPSASQYLVINVNASGTFNWDVLNSSGSFGGVTGCQYIIYNFYNTTTLNITSGNAIEGTVFAPNADIVKTGNSSNLEGQVIAKSYTNSGGENHFAVFAPCVCTGTEGARHADGGTTTGVSTTVASEVAVKVYPNPADGVVYVAIPSVYEQADIMIADISGRLIETRSIIENKGEPVEFNTSKLTPGMYFVRVNAGGNTNTFKLIVR